jgi:hypothetical protein
VSDDLNEDFMGNGTAKLNIFGIRGIVREFAVVFIGMIFLFFLKTHDIPVTGMFLKP